MDHLESPHNPLFPPRNIPVLNSVPYDKLDFFGYPSRCGFNESRLLAGDFSQDLSNQMAGFLQNWLYFGVLWEVLGDAGSQDRFVEPDMDFEHGRVSTTMLEDSVCLRLSEPLIKDTIQRIRHCLTRLHTFCCLASTTDDTRAFAAKWSLPAEVDLSFRVLGTYLWPAFFWNTDYCLFFPVGYSTLLRMKDLGWCLSEITMLAGHFSPSALEYISTLPRLANGLDHSTCGSTLCVARQLNIATYETKHASPNCTCEHIWSPLKQVLRILGKRQIPLLSMDISDRGDINLHVESYIEGQDYVAFSHVWSDGLGNPVTNSLPRCQYCRLKKLLDGLCATTTTWHLVNTAQFDAVYRRYRNRSVRFWLDTLCIPVDSKYAKERLTALQLMKETYQLAKRVLILDSELESHATHSPVETFMRVSICGWMRRLWTLQEGALGVRLYVKLKDGYTDLEAAHEAWVGWPSYRKKTGRIRWDVLSDVRQTLRSHTAMSIDASTFYWKLRILRAAFALPHPQRHLVGITMPHLFRPGDPLRVNAAIMEAFSASIYRSTSREDDEFTCLASLLTWDITKLREMPIDERMHHLLSSQTTLPQSLIFLAGPRIDKDGWRWAVSRFGNHGYKQLNVRNFDVTPGTVNTGGFTVDLCCILHSRGFDSNIPDEFVIQMHDNLGGAWIRVTRHEDQHQNHPKEVQNSAYGQHGPYFAVLFFLPFLLNGINSVSANFANVRAAAAVVSIFETQCDIFNADVSVNCSVEYLAHLDVLEVDAACVMQNRNANCKVFEERAWCLKRKRTVV
ncbi:hypothetical protein K491DRAFT_607929 [Lophiostoma macrostomum CBS 122681]|uniref:Heterokaryon incompatibility domain-containing protein n=1 Tax=Lophiostoma macrostomum CBS 122681 TaxID=1314788 RepID=A0A6A6SWH2_9PLEO|nr:hypothetical protein K491DRAFT_607929 [Lophiostoma macrostomum CBS 122681]